MSQIKKAARKLYGETWNGRQQLDTFEVEPGGEVTLLTGSSYRTVVKSYAQFEDEMAVQYGAEAGYSAARIAEAEARVVLVLSGTAARSVYGDLFVSEFA